MDCWTKKNEIKHDIKIKQRTCWLRDFLLGVPLLLFMSSGHFFYSHTIVQQIIHSSEMIYFFQYYYTTCFSNLTKFMGFFFRNRVQFMFKISLFKAKITLHECLHVTGLNVLKKIHLWIFWAAQKKRGKTISTKIKILN